MSNIIPPLLSDTPPPPPDVDEHEEDEFGDFTGINNVSFDCDDNFSPSGSPLDLPIEPFDFDRVPPEIVDINSNSKENMVGQISQLNSPKDFHDKRKHCDSEIFEKAINTDELSNPVSVNKVELLPDATELNITTEAKEIIETNCDKEETSSQSEITKLSRDCSEQFKQLPLAVEKHLQHNNHSTHCSHNTDLSELESSPIANGIDFKANSSTNSDILNNTTSSSSENTPDIADVQQETCDHSNNDIPTLEEIENVKSAGNDADSDFGDFDEYNNRSECVSSASEESKDADVELFAKFDLEGVKATETPVKLFEEDDDEFNYFVTAEVKDTVAEIPTFANFDSFSSSAEEIAQTEDDFGDFATTTLYCENQLDESHTKILLLNEKQALEKATRIVQEMFPPIEQMLPDFVFKGLEASDKIFNQIKNITDTHALSYHWNKSASQKLLLKSLNIDSRNIMFGTGWNPAMPRFASSLSVQPLEPVKSEMLTPISIKNSATPQQSANVDGLKLEIGEPPLSEPIGSLPVKEANNVSTASTISNILELKESTLNSKSSSTVLDKVKNTVEVPQPDLDQKPEVQVKLNDFDDFVSYLPPLNQESSHGHSIILRETHISNKEPSKSEENDIVSWLEPTIVTPELTRKERHLVEGDEEFDDFQMVVPENQVSQLADSATNLTVKPLAFLQPQSVIENKEVKNVPKVIMNPGCMKSSLEENSSQDRQLKMDVNNVSASEDDFGDFTFSLPKSSNTLPSSLTVPRHSSSMVPGETLTPVSLLEPLKPSVVKGQSVAPIRWPDPGVTDDEISRFEALGYARAQHEPSKEEKVVRVPQKQIIIQSALSNAKIAKPPLQNSKQNSIDDEEWSDFVSVKNSSPVHKLKVEKERSSTPDLPLSVLNLGTVHPTKQPIPVITPNGLMQTKLSSNMSSILSNKMPQKNKVFPQTQVPINQLYQPSIISNQFASQAFGGFSSYQSPVSKSSAEDDEWSDFVSHQPTLQKTSQVRPLPQQPNQFSSWMNSTPNITANPAASFNVSGSSAEKQVKTVPGSPAGGRNAPMSTVSIPDLDFLAPRNRTAQRK